MSDYSVLGHHLVVEFITESYLLPLGNQGLCQSTMKLLRALQGYLAVLNFASPDTSYTFCWAFKESVLKIIDHCNMQ